MKNSQLICNWTDVIQSQVSVWKLASGYKLKEEVQSEYWNLFSLCLSFVKVS